MATTIPGKDRKLLPFYHFVFRFTRRNRMRRFAALFRPRDGITICDVGGTKKIWDWLDCRPQITIINLGIEESHAGNFHYLPADSTDLPFPDGHFDIAFSNSVIEHLGDFETQRRFAREQMRVGRSLFVQTPAKEFPLEIHLLTPFIHWLPVSWQRPLLRFTVRGLIKHWSRADADTFLDQIRLLTKREMRELFPGCEIHVERVLGLPKSYIAVRRA
ncbi:MAG: hypothetical protein MAG453_00981 [Calditrichaeota bacterium]|nr:hypothetical protein [Calditrichota bacterium]